MVSSIPQSTGPHDRLQVSDLARHLKTLLDLFQVKAPLRAILGLGEGGLTALAFAKYYGSLVDKIVLAGTILNDELLRAQLGVYANLDHARLISTIVAGAMPGQIPNATTGVLRYALERIRPMALAKFASYFETINVEDLLLHAKLPILQVLGGQSESQFAENLAHSVQTVTIPSAGNLPVLISGGCAEFLNITEPFLKTAQAESPA